MSAARRPLCQPAPEVAVERVERVRGNSWRSARSTAASLPARTTETLSPDCASASASARAARLASWSR